MTFTWRRTFEDTHHDFVADAPEGQVGRIMKQRLSGLGRDVWVWSATGLAPTVSEIGPVRGEVATRAEAIDALADAYSRARAWGARTGRPFVRPPPPEQRPIVGP